MADNDYVDPDSFYAARRSTGRFSYSGRFTVTRYFPNGPSEQVNEPARFAYQVLDPDNHTYLTAGQGSEVLIRETGTRQQIKAVFLEDDRSIQNLILQRFNSTGVALRDQFNLTGNEIQILRDFLRLIESVDIPKGDEGGQRLDSETTRQILDSPEVAAEVYENRKEEIYSLIEDDLTARDVLALRKKRHGLNEFERMLKDARHFESLRDRADGKRIRREDVWQEFFEANRWMFGLGLAPQVMLSWKPGKYEQMVVGRSIAWPGKKVDALLSSAGILRSISVVEIKRHDVDLLVPDSYRAGAWRAAEHLSGGIAQCHANIDSLIREHQEIAPKDDRGFIAGETSIVCRPRCYLIIGSLDEFKNEWGLNDLMFRSFENLRRSVGDPEIVTFDELFERAKLTLHGLEAADNHE